jgi:Rrf2 family protein
MKLVPTRRTDYGLRALIFLAEHHGGLATGAEIAEGMAIPTNFLHQVLRELQRARLVTSRASRGGGYSLARGADAISVLDVVEALEGPIDTDECVMRGGPCQWDEVCAVHRVWSAARMALSNQLASASIATLAGENRALSEGRLAIPEDSHRRVRAPKSTTASRRAR